MEPNFIDITKHGFYFSSYKSWLYRFFLHVDYLQLGQKTFGVKKLESADWFCWYSTYSSALHTTWSMNCHAARVRSCFVENVLLLTEYLIKAQHLVHDFFIIVSRTSDFHSATSACFSVDWLVQFKLWFATLSLRY